MIDIRIATNGDQVGSIFNKDNITLSEVSVTLRELELVKRDLLDIEFDGTIEGDLENG